MRSGSQCEALAIVAHVCAAMSDVLEYFSLPSRSPANRTQILAGDAVIISICRRPVPGTASSRREFHLSARMRRRMWTIATLLLLLTRASASAAADCGTEIATAKRWLKVGALLPHANTFPWSLSLAGPAMMYALETVRSRADFVDPVSNLTVVWGDSRCSDVHGPLVAFDMYVNQSVDAFVGPGCDYAVAPIARFSPFWNKPVITGGALVHAFGDKSVYELLTRISGSYDKLGEAIASLFADYNWTIAGMMYHNNLDHRRHLGKSTEHFIMEGIYVPLLRKFKRRYPDRQLWNGAFDENALQKEMFFNIEAILKDASNNTRSRFTFSYRDRTHDH